jgi:hypothetical protein
MPATEITGMHMSLDFLPTTLLLDQATTCCGEHLSNSCSQKMDAAWLNFFL